jgi:N-acetylmuramoyl-L-alanine amidase
MTKRNKTTEIILHCSATPEGKDIKTETIRRWHIQGNKWQDIGYHYVIELDGTVHEGRKIELVGAHCTSHNSFSIGICYVGGVDKNNKLPKDTRTQAQKESMYKLVKILLDKYKLSLDKVHCHNEFSAKSCPCFSINTFRKEYNEFYNKKRCPNCGHEIL